MVQKPKLMFSLPGVTNTNSLSAGHTLFLEVWNAYSIGDFAVQVRILWFAVQVRILWFLKGNSQYNLLLFDFRRFRIVLYLLYLLRNEGNSFYHRNQNVGERTFILNISEY